MKNEFSVWQDTVKLFESETVRFGKRMSNLFLKDSSYLIDLLTLYKFAAKMGSENSRILEINCRDGIGAQILSEGSKLYVGIDKDNDLIKVALNNNKRKNVDFLNKTEMNSIFDAVVDLNHCHYIDDLLNYNFDFLQTNLPNDGIFIVSCSNKLLKKSLTLEKAHEKTLFFLKGLFYHVLPFGMNNDLISAGFSVTSDYLICLCCHVKDL